MNNEETTPVTSLAHPVKFTTHVPSLSQASRSLSIFYINMRSIARRMSQLEAAIAALPFRPDVVVVAETWIYDAEAPFFNLPGYTSFHSGRPLGSSRGDGCAVFVDEILSPNLMESIFIADVSIIVVALPSIGTKIVGIYRPGKTSSQIFLPLLDDLLSRHKHAIWLGDFNINLRDSGSEETREYIQTLNTNGFIPLNSTDPAYVTRLSNGMGTTIDHVVTDVLNKKYLLAVTDNAEADHQNIFLLLPKNPNNPPTLKDYSLKILNHQAVSRSPLWTSIENHTNFNDISHSLSTLISENTSIITKRSRGSYTNPWISRAIIEAIHFRDLLARYVRRFPQNPMLSLWHSQCKKDIVRQIRRAKKDFCNEKIAGSLQDSKKLWASLKEIIHNRSSAPTPASSSASVMVERADCDRFNDFFVNVGSSISAGYPLPSREYFNSFSYTISNYLPLSQSDPQKVFNNIRNLDASSATGIDGISPKFIKTYADRLSTPISNAINNSFDSGVFPPILKEAVVVPIHKTGPKSDPNSFRPISVLPAMNMLIESEIKEWFTSFCSANNIIHPHQFGFVKRSNAVAAIAHMMEFISGNLDRGNYVAILFLDIRKAFDCINHTILLEKLGKLNLHPREFDILKSYFDYRSQVVRMKGVLGNSLPLITGVPQGSKIGPDAFNFYLNDIFTLALYGSLQLFADDAALKYRASSLSALIQDMQSDLTLLAGWFETNHLTINVSKSKFLIFSRNAIRTSQINNFDPQLAINGQSLERVRSYTYLGVVIDDGLRFTPHIQKVIKVITPYIFALNRSRQFITEHTALLLYFAYIYPHLSYAAPVWRSAATTNLQPLRIKQKRAIKSIFRLPILTPTDTLFSPRLLSLDAILSLESTTFAFKVIHDLVHNSLTIRQASDIHVFPTRARHMYRIEPCSSDYGLLNVLRAGLVSFNALPPNIRGENNLITFRRLLRDHLCGATVA